MAPAVVAIFLVSLFVEGLSAPSWCGDCQTWESHSGSQTHRGFGREINQENLSQRSENLEDLTQQVETEPNRSPNQFTFDNTRPGNWTDVNHYRTPDGHGRVYEEQGQRVDGTNRIRFSKRNFTSSYSSGNLGSFGETNLGRIYPNIGQDESQLLNRESLHQSQNSAYDRFLTGQNSHTAQDSLHSTERVNSHNDASRYYENLGNSGQISKITSGQSVQQGIDALDQTRPGNWTDVNHYRTPDGHGRVYEEQGQRVDGTNRIRFSKRNFTSSYSSGNLGSFGETNLGRIYPNIGQDESQLLNRESLHQSQNSAYDRFLTGQNSHTAQDSLHSTERVNSHNDASRYYENLGNSGQISKITSGQSVQQGINALDQTRPGNWSTVNTFGTNEGNGRVYEERGQFVTGPRRVHFYVRNYTSSYASDGGIPTLGLGGEDTRNVESSVQQQQRLFDSYGRELHQSKEGSTNGGYTQHYRGHYTSPSQTTRQTNYRYVSRPTSYELQNQNALNSNSDQTYQHTTNLGNEHVSQSSSSSFSGLGQVNERNPNPAYSTGSYTSGSRYNHLGTLEIPSSGHTGHRIPYYDQFQTTSDSSSAAISRPDTDLRTIQSGSDQERQRTLNTHNSFDQTTTNNQKRIYRVQNGQLVTQGIDLGQIAQGPDCAEGTNGYSSYEQSYHRVYRGAAESPDLSQQVQDLTQQTEDLTQQTEDLTQQTQDLTQQTEDLTQQNQDFGQQSYWRPGKLEVGSQQVEDLTQQTEDLTQQTEDLTQQTQDLTQQTEDLTQQTQDFGQQSSWSPGKLEVSGQQVEDLTQQTEDLTQQTEDLTQQTQDLTQQTEDLTQQTEDLTQQTQDFGQQSPWRPGKLEVGSQQVEDLTQQTEDLTQQTEDLTQQTEDLTQQTEGLTQQTEDLTQQTEDLTQQTEDLTQQTEDLGQQSSWRPGKLEVGSQQVEDLTQQTEDLTQQTEDLTQQTQDLTQQTEDLTQQTEDLTQQTQDFGQQSSWRPGKLEVGSQQVEDLTQQTEDLTQQTQDFEQQSSWRPGKLELGSQQVEDLTQQTEDLTQQTEDLTQQTEGLTQQTEDLTQQTEDLTQQNQDFGQQSYWRPGKLEVGSQQVEDLSQQTEDLTQQTEDLTQQTEDLTQQTEGLTQQTEDLTQQTEDLTQQNQDFGQQSYWRPGKLEVGSQQVEDLTQQTEDLTQQTQDLTQQTEDLGQQTEDFDQQTQDLTQQTEDFGQQTQDLTQQSEDLGQQTEDFGQQTQDLTQQTEDLGQQIQDLTQQTEDLYQQTHDLTQQTEDFGQQTQDLTQQTEDFGQQTQDLTQQTEDLGQQTEDLYQQTQDLTQQTEDFGQQTQDLTQQTEDLGQQTEDLYQQTHDLTQKTEDFGQQTQDLTQQTEDFGQQTQDLTQQTEDLGQQTEDLGQQTEDFGQQTEDLYQQTHDLTQQTEDFGQQTQDLTQQTEDLGQQTEDLYQQTHDLTQKTEDFSQQTQDLTQQTEDFSQQTQDLTQQTEDLGQQTEDFGQQTEDLYQQTHDLTQQVEDFGQQTQDLTQQTEDFGQQTQDLTQQTEDLGQQTEDLYQQTHDLTQQTEDLYQQTHDLTQQTEDFGQQTQDLSQQIENLGQQTEDLGQQTEDLTQQTEHLNQQTQGIFQETDGQSQQTENFNSWGEQITSSPGFGQESYWNSDNLEIGGQQTENFNQENQFGEQQTIIHPGQSIRPAPKPAPKPRRQRPANFHHTQQINIEIDEPTVSDAHIHTAQYNNQENSEKWISTGVPPIPQRGDQGINVHSNEPEEADINIEKISEHQIQYVSAYPDSTSQQTTSGNQFRQTQSTKTKTSRRRGNDGAPYQGPQGWQSRDLSISQDPSIRLVDRRISSGDSNLPQSANTGQVIQDFQQHLTNPEEIEQLESRQTVQRIQPLGAAIESRQRNSDQSDRIVFPDSSEPSFSPRILEAFGANGPYGEHDLDIFDSAKHYPDTTTVLTPPENGNDWDIREVDRTVTTTTEAPTPLPTTTTPTTTTTTTTPSPPPTPAPGFWKKLGNTFSSTVEKAKEKARDWFG